MTPERDAVINKLFSSYRKFHWVGWYQKNGYSDRFVRKEKNWTFGIYLKTISPRSLFKIKLFLYYQAPWGTKLPEFDPDEHDWQIELSIEDELKRYSRIEIYFQECYKRVTPVPAYWDPGRLIPYRLLCRHRLYTSCCHRKLYDQNLKRSNDTR